MPKEMFAVDDDLDLNELHNVNIRRGYRLRRRVMLNVYQFNSCSMVGSCPLGPSTVVKAPSSVAVECERMNAGPAAAFD